MRKTSFTAIHPVTSTAEIWDYLGSRPEAEDDLMSENEKARYEPPVTVPLGELSTGLGATCGLGSTPQGPCGNGSRPIAQCGSGNDAAGLCKVGNVAQAPCKNGAGAGGPCIAGNSPKLA